MILLISDLHKSLDSMEEMNSVKWLLNVLDELKPDYLIGARDWGEAMAADDFSEILTRIMLITVYGNHENFTTIRNLSIGWRGGEGWGVEGFRDQLLDRA
ncbi:MAG: hypothetical protein RXO22_01800 [Thermocladium sp.]